jgi:hypothetical protein
MALISRIHVNLRKLNALIGFHRSVVTFNNYRRATNTAAEPQGKSVWLKCSLTMCIIELVLKVEPDPDSFALLPGVLCQTALQFLRFAFLSQSMISTLERSQDSHLPDVGSSPGILRRVIKASRSLILS